MIEFKSVLTNQIIEDCFATDPELIEKWHLVAGDGLEACSKKTYEDMFECNVDFYCIEDNKNLVGYYGVENYDGMKFLTGFFIKPSYRNKEYIKEFWNMIDNKMNDTYMIGIYNKNERAKNFLLKKTPIFFEVPESKSVFFKVERE
jgi:N-acetylglutamate synthase-like GNAT family acetyltransferase